VFEARGWEGVNSLLSFLNLPELICSIGDARFHPYKGAQSESKAKQDELPSTSTPSSSTPSYAPFTSSPHHISSLHSIDFLQGSILGYQFKNLSLLLSALSPTDHLPVTRRKEFRLRNSSSNDESLESAESTKTDFYALHPPNLSNPQRLCGEVSSNDATEAWVPPFSSLSIIGDAIFDFFFLRWIRSFLPLYATPGDFTLLKGSSRVNGQVVRL
jgi:hypothetical protein